MIRRWFIVCLCLLATGAQAQSIKLTATQITTLLSGNTVYGSLDGETYRQYFDPNGIVTVQTGPDQMTGSWRIDPAMDELQRQLSGAPDWTGWYVMEYAGAHYWVSKATPPTPFRIDLGRVLSAPQ